MQRFKSIFYIVESISTIPKITEKVQTLARLNDANVHIALLQEPLPSHFVNTHGFQKRMEELKLFFKQEREDFLHNILNDKGWFDIDVDGLIISGIGFVEIIKQVLREKHDLIVIEEPTLTRIKIGQLAMKLMRKCPCPVWIIRSEPNVKIKNILAAVDIEGGDESLKLNTKIVQLANSLAQREQGVSHYLHAYRFEFETALAGPSFNVPLEEIAGMKKEIINSRKLLMQKTLESAQLQVNENQLIFREGDPTTVIRETINELSIDTLVMGSLERSGVPGYLIGNRAETILTEIECSVLTVKPDDFISPITL